MSIYSIGKNEILKNTHDDWIILQHFCMAFIVS